MVDDEQTKRARPAPAKTVQDAREDARRILQDISVLYREGRHQEALDRCRKLLTLFPTRSEVLAVAGKIATDLGEMEEAVAFYEAAVKAKPEAAELHYNLGLALSRLGRGIAAVDAYRRAARQRPELLPVQNNLGTTLLSLGRFEEAVEVFRTALALAPDAKLHRNLGIALEGAGRRGAAIDSYRRALALEPGWLALYQNLATALLEHGEAAAAVAVCDAWLARRPGLPEPLGLKAVALDELGDRAGARRLVDLDRFVRMVQFDRPPAGYDSLEAFNAALSQAVLAHPTLRTPTEAEPHYNGSAFRTTRELFGPTDGPWAALETMFSRQLADYLGREVRPDPTHPFLSHPLPPLRPSAVATVLDRLGSLAPHVHYAGYISGVYYCRVPAIIGAPGQGRAGWFEIGRVQQRFQRHGKPEIRTIQPREGMMLLFPSYFFHGTVPFDGGDTRISIAFDTIPPV
ncbi:MAG: tetratricopeptide repeat protein [Stellaceae bacterium]